MRGGWRPAIAGLVEAGLSVEDAFDTPMRRCRSACGSVVLRRLYQEKPNIDNAPGDYETSLIDPETRR